jgi:transposase
MHLDHLEFLDHHLKLFDARIEQLIEQHRSTVEVFVPTVESKPQTDSTSSDLPLDWQQAMPLLDSIPGIARQSAELLLAEIGRDMPRFPSTVHLCKWAGGLSGQS